MSSVDSTYAEAFEGISVRQPRTDLISHITDWAIILTYTYIAIPETIIPHAYRYVGPAPLEYPLFYVCFGLLLLDSMINGLRLTKLLLFSYIATLYMLFLGIAYGYELRNLVQDASYFFGIVAGMSLAARRSFLGVTRILARIRDIYFVMVPSTMILMSLGMVPLAFEIDATGGRMIVQNLFFPVCFLAVVLPFLTTMENVFPDIKTFIGKRLGFLFGLATVLAAAIVTGTRTLAGLALLCGLVWAPIQMRQRKWAVLIQALVIVLWSTFFFGEHASITAGVLSARFQKFQESDITQETRYLEARGLLRKIKGHELTGLGFGSHFQMGYVVARSGRSWSLAAHIGVLNFLLKGGVLVFIGFVIVPFFLAIRRFIFPIPGQKVLTALWGGIAIHLTLSCISGGYNFPTMFAYGILLSLALNEERRLKLLKYKALQSRARPNVYRKIARPHTGLSS
jgi:hypothetical protein